MLLDIEGVNITAHPSGIVAFSEIHQILTIPQSQLLLPSHQVRRKTRQDNLRRKRVISG